MTNEVSVGARPLRVLYVMHNAAPGGAARSLLYLIQSFPVGTVEPYVLCPNGPAVPLFEEAGARVFSIPGVSMFMSIAGVPLRGRRLAELLRTLWFMRYGSVIRKTIADVQPDVVHLNERGMFQAAVIARRSGVPVVMHARSVADRRTRWVMRLTSWLTNRFVDRVIAINESVRGSLPGLKRCGVIYNPMPVKKGGQLPEGSEPQSGRLNGGRVRVCFLAGLLPSKGIWDLLESARIVQARDDILFQIAGGNSRPREHYQTLRGRFLQMLGFTPDIERAARAWIAREKLEQNVIMLGHIQDVDAVLAETDVLVFPSHLNGPGRSVFEAGARGIPAIVALADRVEDVVEDEVTGLIVPERDPQALAKAIVRLSDDPTLRARLGANARRKYLAQFDAKRIAEQMLKVYQSVVAENRQKSHR